MDDRKIKKKYEYKFKKVAMSKMKLLLYYTDQEITKHRMVEQVLKISRTLYPYEITRAWRIFYQ